MESQTTTIAEFLDLRQEQGFSAEAVQALDFARQHDWGRAAFLDHAHGREWIRGLTETITKPAGDVETYRRTRQATVSALREFRGN